MGTQREDESEGAGLLRPLRTGADICPGLVYKGVSLLHESRRGDRKKEPGAPAPDVGRGQGELEGRGCPGGSTAES